MASPFSHPLRSFLNAAPNEILGVLAEGLANEGFDTSKLEIFAWVDEIEKLQKALRRLAEHAPDANEWHILLEYVIPIVKQRIDCVLLARDLIFVIEYKAGDTTPARSALRQAQDYAMNLMDFHEESRNRVAIPIALGNFQKQIPFNPLATPLDGSSVSPDFLPETISAACRAWAAPASPIDPDKWNRSRYFPVPTIIEAASAVYHNHDVRDLAFSRSGMENLEATQDAILSAVRDAMARSVKKLLIVTGVPGSGKTLAGLDAVQKLQQHLDLNSEQASFLSGNAPLVHVLQTALKRSAKRRQGNARSVQSRIREMHRFILDSFADERAPADRLIVFDEAQRSWTAEKCNKKKFLHGYSEPEMTLKVMARHPGWAVIVALVGGGQEIHSGEAGLAAWGDALSRNPEWEVETSPEALHGGTAVAGSRLFRAELPPSVRISETPRLHLDVCRRTFATENTAAWVNALLEGDHATCAKLVAQSKHGFPICMTRDLAATRRWLMDRAKGHRRAGLLASSGALRLRADGVEAPTFYFLKGVDYASWFLEPAGDIRSSNQLEVALSEFELQGLEIDLAGLLWGGDLVFPHGKISVRKFSGTRWKPVPTTNDIQASADDQYVRTLNKYRVLLTRFRKAMVIFVPRGSPDDPTRNPEDFDGVYDYLLQCGIKPI